MVGADKNGTIVSFSFWHEHQSERILYPSMRCAREKNSKRRARQREWSREGDSEKALKSKLSIFDIYAVYNDGNRRNAMAM